MSQAFLYESPAIGLPYAGDADPNAGAPAPNRRFDPGRRTEHEELTLGVRYFLDFTGAAAGTQADVTVWILDAKSGKWASTVTITALKDKQLALELDTGPGVVFFQLTNVVDAGATDVTIRAAAA